MNRNRIIGISIVTLIMGILLVVVNLYIDYNLRKYSVYYAHNMEHKEGTHPEMAMVLENYDLVYEPDIKGIEYRTDGGHMIYNHKNSIGNLVPTITFNRTHEKGQYSYYDNINANYEFDESFTLIYFRDKSKSLDRMNPKTINQKALYKDIYKNFGFLVEANVNRKPLINMQKEFDKKYYKRFN